MSFSAFAEAAQAGLEAFLDDPGPVIAYINEIWPDFEISVGEAAYEVMSGLVVSDTTDQLGLGAMDGAVWDGVAGRMYEAGVISTAGQRRRPLDQRVPAWTRADGCGRS